MASSPSCIMDSLSPAQRDLVHRLKVDPDRGLSTDDVTRRREESSTAFNVVKPPIDCPPTVCCLLPCIKHVPSMKAFLQIQPDDAEVLRNGQWIRYDVTSLVVGDIIRLEEGDIVPADCVVLSLSTSSSSKSSSDELLVDVRAITAEDSPRSAKRVLLSSKQQQQQKRNDDNGKDAVDECFVVQPVQLYWGGTVVQGGCLAVVTAIGQDCYIATLIAAGKFPPPHNILQQLVPTNQIQNYDENNDMMDHSNNNDDDDTNTNVHGIALLAQSPKPMIRETV